MRLYQVSVSGNMPVFNVACGVELSMAQGCILHWSKIYTDIFGLPADRRPNESVIDNDVMFDNWLKSYINECDAADIKRAKQMAKARNKR